MAIKPKGIFPAKVIEAYLAAEFYNGLPKKAEQKRIFLEDEVTYYRSWWRGGYCIYMDVGLWAGGPSAGENKKRFYFYPRHREFGVVCGDIVLLCCYPNDKVPVGNPCLDRTRSGLNRVRKSNFWQSAENLLKELSKDDHLGGVKVINAMVFDDWKRLGKNPFANRTVPHDIYIFLGDLHIPVITQARRAFLLPDHIVERITNRDSIIKRPEKVSRCGRIPQIPKFISEFLFIIRNPVDLVIFKEIIRKIIKKYWDELQLKEFYPPENAEILKSNRIQLRSAEPPHITTYCTPPDWPILGADIRKEINAKERFMGIVEAECWFEKYYGRVNFKGIRPPLKGADIFEDAGSDLMRWINLIKGFKPTRYKENLFLIQLGDLYDFWLGFKCGLQSKDNAGPGFLPSAGKFSEFWKTETSSEDGKYSSKHAKIIRELENLGCDSVETHFLYGNHDNYRVLSDGLKPRFTDDVNGLIWAEHGHDSDEFNSDEDCVLGWALTQFAFFYPSIRSIENPLGAIFSKFLSHSPGERLTRLGHGADDCFDNHRMVYIMGHTHRATLKKVRFRQYL